MKKYGQASLEYLTTYGWAFILIIVMIGALAYFGVLNPKKLLPDRCNFGAEFECRDFKVSAASKEITMKFKNNVGEHVTIKGDVLNIVVSGEGGNFVGCAAFPVGDITINTGELKEIKLACTDFGALTAGNKERIQIKLNYFKTKSGANYARPIEGEILTTLQ